MRAARTNEDPAPRLLPALDQATGTVLAQARVADKSNEIPALGELLKPLDLDGVVVTADAMHAQTTWRPIKGTITTTETSTPYDLVRITSYLTDDAEEAQGH